MTEKMPSGDDREIVNFWEKHLSQPCQTPEGFTMRASYVSEAQRMLDNNEITDPAERTRLESIIKLARIFERDVDQQRP